MAHWQDKISSKPSGSAALRLDKLPNVCNGGILGSNYLHNDWLKEIINSRCPTTLEESKKEGLTEAQTEARWQNVIRYGGCEVQANKATLKDIVSALGYETKAIMIVSSGISQYKFVQLLNTIKTSTNVDGVFIKARKLCKWSDTSDLWIVRRRKPDEEDDE